MYNPQWAKTVVDRLYRSYTRASYSVFTVTPITAQTVVHWLARSPDSEKCARSFELFKAFVKVLEPRLSHHMPLFATQTFSKQTRSIVAEVFQEFGEKCPPRLFTTWESWLHNEFAELKERPKAAPRENQSQDEHQLVLPF